MHPFKKAAFFAIAFVGLFGLADYSPAEVGTGERLGGERAALPEPIVGDDLFADRRGNAVPCVAAERIIEGFVLDIENVGGEIVILADGIQQKFSDSWRGLVDQDRVAVSLVLAHLVPERGGDPMADVVEIDNSGCALSRTLLAADDWTKLLALASAIEI